MTADSFRISALVFASIYLVLILASARARARNGERRTLLLAVSFPLALLGLAAGLAAALAWRGDFRSLAMWAFALSLGMLGIALDRDSCLNWMFPVLERVGKKFFSGKATRQPGESAAAEDVKLAKTVFVSLVVQRIAFIVMCLMCIGFGVLLLTWHWLSTRSF